MVVTTLDSRIGARLWDDWTSLWNGELEIASRLVTPGFRIHFGGAGTADADALRGPDGIAGFIGGFRARYERLVYRADVGPLVDGDKVAARWIASGSDAAGGEFRKGGIDILRCEGDRIAEVWSVTGERLL